MEQTRESIESAAQAAPGAAAQDAPGKLEWTNLSFKGAFLEERTNRRTGEVFYDVRIPPNTKIAGAIDVGGYHFAVNGRRVRDSKYDRNGVVVGVVKGRPLKLSKSVKQDDGTYREITREVEPENLRLALIAQSKAYKAEKAAERAALGPRSPSPAKDQKIAAKSAAARAGKPHEAPAKSRSR